MWRPQKGKKPYVRQIKQIKQQKVKNPARKNILADNYDKNDYTKNVEVLHNMKTSSKEERQTINLFQMIKRIRKARQCKISLIKMYYPPYNVKKIKKRVNIRIVNKQK